MRTLFVYISTSENTNKRTPKGIEVYEEVIRIPAPDLLVVKEFIAFAAARDFSSYISTLMNINNQRLAKVQKVVRSSESRNLTFCLWVSGNCSCLLSLRLKRLTKVREFVIREKNPFTKFTYSGV